MPSGVSRAPAVWLLVLATIWQGVALADTGQIIQEPVHYRTADYNSPVPATVTGASVIESARALQKFLDQNPTGVLLDVFPAVTKPKNLPDKELWIEPRRKTLSGASWLANTGAGNLSEEVEALFKTQLKRLTSGDKQHAVIIFCEPECWHSWNAAKRAVSYGYVNVYWYRQGVSGWMDANLPVETKQPVRP